MSSRNRISRSVGFDPLLFKRMNIFIKEMKRTNPQYSRSLLVNQAISFFMLTRGGLNKKLVERFEVEKKLQEIDLELKYAKELITEATNE